MRAFLSFLLVALLAAAGYGYLHNPEGYARLCHDFVVLYTETSVPPDVPAQPTVAPSSAANPSTDTTSSPASTSLAPAPVIAPAPAANTNTVTASAPPIQPFKKWTPPPTIPAQPHWTWTTDDKTYQDVVINQIDSQTVTITHSMGVTHLDISTLPPDIQKQLNYDPAIAQAAAKHAASLQPNEPFQNGDFSQGDDHWQGDGKMPQAYAEDNPAALTDPLTSKGLIVTLNPSSWTRIYQTFASGNGTHYSIVVTYKLSPNISLSKNAADYVDISKKIQIPGFENFGSLAMQPGDFYGTIGDPTSTSMSMELFVPPVGSSQVQTYQHTYPPVPLSPTKTFALAFPPGTGTVVILSVDVTGN